jgi:hypothetical protein
MVLLWRANFLLLGVSPAKRRGSAAGSLRSERIFEAKDRQATVLGAHPYPKRKTASTPRLGMNPAIMPIKKHQVASIVCFSGAIE